jgi:chromosomal replication initiation ATPase DnaA
VALVYGIQVYVLTQPGRSGSVPRAKQIAAHLMKKHLNMSTTAIGEAMRVDHSTVVKGAVVLRGLMETEDLFARHVELVERVLLGETVGDILNRHT